MVCFIKSRLTFSVLVILLSVTWSISGCRHSAIASYTDILTDSINSIVSDYDGEIGVALIVNGKDTVAVNNENIYPLMSVFKVHQALAICEDFDRKGISLDTLLTIHRHELDPNTWSPMLKEHTDTVFTLSVKDLLHYTLSMSDNNASNLMFRELVGVAQSDSLIATLIPRESFQIAYTEYEMSAAHDKAYANCTSPLGAAALMARIFTDSIVSETKQSFIKRTLEECITGRDRIKAGLPDNANIYTAHKTGSGYRTATGRFAAHNDVAFIILPDGPMYALAVFVKDFNGNEEQASEAITRISAAVYSLLEKQ